MPDDANNDDASTQGQSGGDGGEGQQQQPPEPGQGGRGTGEGDERRTYTQAEFDRLLAGRLAAERKKFADYEDLKSKASEFDKLSEAQKSDLERAQEKAAAEERRRIDLERELQEVRLERALADAAGPKDIPAQGAIAMVDRNAVEYDDQGRPTNLDEVLDALAEREPWLVQQQNGRRSTAGAADQGTRQTAETDMDSWSVDKFREELRRGR